jgi:hypothetical protein
MQPEPSRQSHAQPQPSASARGSANRYAAPSHRVEAAACRWRPPLHFRASLEAPPSTRFVLLWTRLRLHNHPTPPRSAILLFGLCVLLPVQPKTRRPRADASRNVQREPPDSRTVPVALAVRLRLSTLHPFVQSTR